MTSTLKAYLILLLGGLFLNSNLFANLGEDSLKIELSFSGTNKFANSDIRVNFMIQNSSGKDIKMPNLFYFGVKEDRLADIIVELEREDSGKYVFVPTGDYNLSYYEESFVILKTGFSRIGSFGLIPYYSAHLPAGKYRIRFFYRVSKHNEVSDVYSNWLLFTIQKPGKE